MMIAIVTNAPKYPLINWLNGENLDNFQAISKESR